ncbi:hypothetical protein D3C73_1072670 [compost metagenome]
MGASYRNKLETALSNLETLKHSGPLGSSLSLISADVGDAYWYYFFYASLLHASIDHLPYTLTNELDTMSFYITDHPITVADLQKPSAEGVQPFTTSAYLPVVDKEGAYYVTVVYYNQAGQAIRYATQQVNLTVDVPAWDGKATQVKDGVTLIRDYNYGERIDYVTFDDYLANHPEAVYFSAVSKSAFPADLSFTAKNALQLINEYTRAYSSEYYPINYEFDEALAALPEDYIIIFYDQNLKAINYYTGTVTD